MVFLCHLANVDYGTEHPESHGTVRIVLTQMPTVLLSGNMAPASAMTGITGLPLQLSLPAEVGCGFIILRSEQSCGRFITAGIGDLPSLITDPFLFG